MGEYRSNSHRSKALEAEETSKERPKVEKVISGSVDIRNNKSRKIMDMFINEDAANVKSYIIGDVLIPAIKNALSDMIKSSADMIFGSGSGSKGNTVSVKNKVSYRSYYDDPRDNHRDYNNSYTPANRFDYDDIVYKTRTDAEAVRNEMLDLIARYGFVRVGDMYDMVDRPAPFTANSYGWTNLRNAEVIRVRDGYILRLPKASPID